MPEPAQLRAKMGTEMFPVRRVQRAIAKSVIGAFKGNHSAFASRQYRRLEGRFDGLKSGIAENSLRRPPLIRTSGFRFGVSSGPPLERESVQLSRYFCLE